MGTIRSGAYVVGLSLTDKAKQALMHAAEVGKDTDVVDDSELRKVVFGLCGEFLGDHPSTDAVVITELVACVPYVDTGYAMLMLVDEVIKTGKQMPGVVNKRLLDYDALVVIKGRSNVEALLMDTYESVLQLFANLFSCAVSPCSCCDVLLNIGR